MLDTIVGLLEKTQVQRDALVQAAERLFSDMRLANNGELDIRTAVHNDPIGMLGRAFSFTIGRFQRFLLRNHTTIEQLEVISQRNLEHARSFLAHTHTLLHSIRQSQSSLAQESGSRGVYEKLQDRADGDHVELLTQATKIQQYLQQTLHHDIEQRTFLFLSQVERAHHLCRQVESELQTHSGVITASSVHGLRSLETQLKGLRQETQTFKKKTSENLTEMDARINHLLSVARTESAHTSHLTVAQVQELTRLAERFYQDVTALAQSLHGITQEMRTNLAPFRLAAIGKG
jgi:methyl-accepting chemotaxis protein